MEIDLTHAEIKNHVWLIQASCTNILKALEADESPLKAAQTLSAIAQDLVKVAGGANAKD